MSDDNENRYLKDMVIFMDVLKLHPEIKLDEKHTKSLNDFLYENSLIDGNLFTNPFVLIKTKTSTVEINVSNINCLMIKDEKNIAWTFKNNPSLYRACFETRTECEIIFLFIRYKMHVYERASRLLQ